MKIGDIQIVSQDIAGFTQHIFTLVVHQTYHALGSYNTIPEGIEGALQSANLRPKDRQDLERLRDIIKEKKGDMKEVRKALIDLES